MAPLSNMPRLTMVPRWDRSPRASSSAPQKSRHPGIILSERPTSRHKRLCLVVPQRNLVATKHPVAWFIPSRFTVNAMQREQYCCTGVGCIRIGYLQRVGCEAYSPLKYLAVDNDVTITSTCATPKQRPITTSKIGIQGGGFCPLVINYQLIHPVLWNDQTPLQRQGPTLVGNWHDIHRQ